MSFRLSPEMMQEIAGLAVFNKGRVILLTRDEAQAETTATHLRAAIRDLLSGIPRTPTSPVLKPEGMNPAFLQLTNGGWVFVWSVTDMTADDDMGSPHFVYWPSEGGAYEQVSYPFWQKLRRAGGVYRPVTVAPPVRADGAPRTVWDRLLVEEDE